MESIKMSITLHVSAEELFKAFLNSKEHASFTGAKAKISTKLNSKFKVWDGYITGMNKEVVPYEKIVQTWRTTEFPDDAEDSILELTFEEKNKKTVLHLYHYNLQKGDAKKYKDGWKEFYFEPMKKYFNANLN